MMNIYETQKGSGPYSRFNCGPACAIMLANANYITIPSVEVVRAQHRSSPFWKNNDIVDTLNKCGVPNSSVSVPRVLAGFTGLLNKNVVIVNINMAKLPQGEHFNKSYRTYLPWWNHYVVVVGHFILNDVLRYKVLDPYDPVNGNGRLYDGRTLYDEISRRGAPIITTPKDIYND